MLCARIDGDGVQSAGRVTKYVFYHLSENSTNVLALELEMTESLVKVVAFVNEPIPTSH
jgi:hypothetical protein